MEAPKGQARKVLVPYQSWLYAVHPSEPAQGQARAIPLPTLAVSLSTQESRPSEMGPMSRSRTPFHAQHLVRLVHIECMLGLDFDDPALGPGSARRNLTRDGPPFTPNTVCRGQVGPACWASSSRTLRPSNGGSSAQLVASVALTVFSWAQRQLPTPAQSVPNLVESPMWPVRLSSVARTTLVKANHADKSEQGRIA